MNKTLNKNNGLIWEVFGWYGMSAILLAYFLVSFNIIATTHFFYQILNVSGSLGIVVVSYQKRAYQPMALNIVWSMIGLAAMAKIILDLA
jgi:hypothetical protein